MLRPVFVFHYFYFLLEQFVARQTMKQQLKLYGHLPYNIAPLHDFAFYVNSFVMRTTGRGTPKIRSITKHVNLQRKKNLSE